ncbi:glycoside hydrolase family 2 TIM barrel-domain containing protein [Labilibaculum antarcticum]|uniref:Beta-galactosidase n=1 Tax=Labilibaculum antarcticum TaxID=1717717 RepID=A0A1Y1CGP8_9BACT|nr:glycoside hydrolase family 2 TIM barrel-domain containing protein [Labilibaculum antarcticum]BAX78461.1 beta-galactosidase [Labilibaculum antarcticum]
MQRLKTSILLVAIIFLAGCQANQPKNSKDLFDFGWKFTKGEAIGAENPNFIDQGWQDVDLPHDWSIEGPFSKENASFSRGAWLPAGKCAYRKSFEIKKNQKDKRFVIYFEGAYRNSEVWINGNFLGTRPLGYASFHYDMTPYINFGGNNTLTVKLDNSAQPGSRWYTGTGIYRHVHLITTDKLYVPVWGNYIVTNDCSAKEATIKIETEIKNDYNEEKSIIVRQTAFDSNSNEVSSIETKENLAAGESKINKSTLKVKNPLLWNPTTPNLYRIKTELIVNGNVAYAENTKTGIRKIEFDATNGFFLNGKNIKLKGVCLHHDGGPLGAAVYARTTERQLEILREMGCNAVRTAHNPFSEEFMNICDSMGFFVMSEMFDEWEKVKEPATTQNGEKIRIPVNYYADIFKKWADKDLTDFVLRDRNHPSVIMWSIGNEIDQMRRPEGAPIGKRLADIVHKLDYRPVTNGVHGYGWGVWPDSTAAATSDIYGYNYIKDDGFIKERKLQPNTMAIVTEHESAQSFYPRGTYLYGDDKKAWWDKLAYEHKDAYEWVEGRDIRGESGMDAWKWVKNRPYVMGMFIWTGFDYLGEVIPFGWPARSSSFAPIDLCGFPKDGFFFYQSQWTDQPMVHIFPHWNLEGHEGETVTVYAYTNCDEVELFQDGKSLGKQKNDTKGVEYQSWDAVYQAGELKAISYINGNQVAEKTVKTAGAPAKILISTRKTEMTANSQDLIYVECTVVDKDGNLVPKADNKIEFSIDGPAVIAGVGNGNNMSHEPFQANYRNAFNGKCLAIIKSTNTAGEIIITAKSVDLESANISLSSK